jgi:hypothetical protein
MEQGDKRRYGKGKPRNERPGACDFSQNNLDAANFACCTQVIHRAGELLGAVFQQSKDTSRSQSSIDRANALIAITKRQTRVRQREGMRAPADWRR